MASRREIVAASRAPRLPRPLQIAFVVSPRRLARLGVFIEVTLRQAVEGEDVGGGGALGHVLALRVATAGNLDPQPMGVLACIGQADRRQRAEAGALIATTVTRAVTQRPRRGAAGADAQAQAGCLGVPYFDAAGFWRVALQARDGSGSQDLSRHDWGSSGVQWGCKKLELPAPQ